MSSQVYLQQLFEPQSSTYTYLLADLETKEALLIDTVLEMVDRDLKLIQELGFHLKYVLDTHVHADHVTGAGEIRRRLGTPTALAKHAHVACCDIGLVDGDELKLGRFSIRALETPGHTDSSLSFVCENMVFTGDALLIRGCGRTDFQGGSSSQLYDSVTQKIFSLPSNTVVYPGHDYKGFTSSTVQAERDHNPRLGQGKTKAQFSEIMANLKLDYPKKIDIALPANQACGLMTHDVPTITAEEIKSLSNSSLLVDVRNPDEFNGELGHIQGAHLVTLGDKLKAFLESYDRSEEIIFICRSGKRSEEATRLSLNLGFKKVHNLIGGMLRWNEVGLPVVRGDQS